MQVTDSKERYEHNPASNSAADCLKLPGGTDEMKMGFRERAKRHIQCLLARYPAFYLQLLRWLNRGSIEKKIYLSLIQSGDVVFDIGANTGHWTLLFSDLVGERGRVHAFEPVPGTFDLLSSRMAALACHPNFHLQKVACSHARGEVVLFMPGTDSGQASLRPQNAGSWLEAASVSRHPAEAVLLDEYVQRQSSSRIDFVKCDVEGAELRVLEGFKATLAQVQPLLFLEVFTPWMKSFGYTAADLISLLESLGYNHFLAVTGKVQVLSNPLNELMTLSQDTSVNLLCAVAERHGARLTRMSAI